VETPIRLKSPDELKQEEKLSDKIVKDIISNLVMEIEDRRVKCWNDLSIFKGIEEECKPGKYCKENIIVDHELFYIPCEHTTWGCKNTNHGIYFRIYKMIDIYERLLEEYGKIIGINDVESGLKAWTIYFTYVYWHGIAHLLIEKVMKLPSIREEEGLAEWFAFSVTQKGQEISYGFMELYYIQHLDEYYNTIIPIIYIHSKKVSLERIQNLEIKCYQQYIT